MKSRSTQEFEAKCWKWAKGYFFATGRAHLIGLAERAVELKEEEEADEDS